MESVIVMTQIMLLNIVLSADNAMLIAMASRKLPAPQRKLAVWIGTAGALLLRVGFVFLAVHLLKWPLLQVLGALMLIWIAVQLLRERHEDSTVSAAKDLRGAIWLIFTADLIMSLDNVLAVAAVAEQNLLYIILGIVLSVPIMVWGSSLFIRLLEKYPFINKIGAVVLFYTAFEMLLAGFK
jgi:YjbE family integral membrane protein